MGTGSRKVIWAPSAHADLDEALARRVDAAHFLEDILDAAASLSTLSERGRLVPEIDDAVTREIFVHDFQIAAAACCATTAGEDLVARAIDDRDVLATLDVEYENHVLVTAPG